MRYKNPEGKWHGGWLSTITGGRKREAGLPCGRRRCRRKEGKVIFWTGKWEARGADPHAWA